MTTPTHLPTVEVDLVDLANSLARTTGVPLEQATLDAARATHPALPSGEAAIEAAAAAYARQKNVPYDLAIGFMRSKANNWDLK